MTGNPRAIPEWSGGEPASEAAAIVVGPELTGLAALLAQSFPTGCIRAVSGVESVSRVAERVLKVERTLAGVPNLVVVLHAEMVFEGWNVVHALPGLSLARHLQTTVPGVPPIVVCGVAPLELVRRCAQPHIALTYVDLLTESRQLGAIARDAALRRGRPAATVWSVPTRALLEQLQSELDAFQRVARPALESLIDHPRMNGSSNVAGPFDIFDADEWRRVRARCAQLRTVEPRQRGESTPLRELRFRVIGIEAVRSGSGTGTPTPDLRRLARTCLSQIGHCVNILRDLLA